MAVEDLRRIKLAKNVEDTRIGNNEDKVLQVTLPDSE
jgi:hypothetical protein